MIFVDTWAWIGLAVKRDQHHAAVKRQHQAFVRERRQYVTSDFVLCELITFLYTVSLPDQAERFIETLMGKVADGTWILERITPHRFAGAWDLRRRLHDKPAISFTDLTSIIVMQELGITDIFSGDDHFNQVGLGLRLFPS